MGGGVVNSDFSKSCVGHKHKHKHRPIVVLKQCTTATNDLDTIYITCDLKEIGHDQNLISFWGLKENIGWNFCKPSKTLYG